MTFTQLNPPIPFRTPKGGGEAIGVIDYGKEDDLIWVVIEDATGEVWGHPNREVRGFPNYSITAPRKGPVEADRDAEDAELFRVWCKAASEQPGRTARVLAACLNQDHYRAALRLLRDAGPDDTWPPAWMPDFGVNAKGDTP